MNHSIPILSAPRAPLKPHWAQERPPSAWKSPWAFLWNSPSTIPRSSTIPIPKFHGFSCSRFWDILGYFESVEGSTSLQREPRWCLPRSWLELVRTGYGPSQEWSGHLWVIFFSKLLNHSMKNGRLFSRWLSSNCGVRPVEFKSTQWHQAPDRDDGCKQETCVSIAFRRVDPKKIRDLPKQ